MDQWKTEIRYWLTVSAVSISIGAKKFFAETETKSQIIKTSSLS